jgi:hypothetical protein
VTYERFPIETDPDALAQDAYDLLSAKTGGVWQPADGNLDVWLLEATARMAAEVRDVAADVPDSIFRTFGEQLLGVPPNDPTNAQAVLNLTMRDWSAYVLPAGTTFGVDDLDGQTHAFALAESVTIASATPAGTRVVQVVAMALEPGADASGIAPRPGNAYLIDAVSYVVQVDLSEATSGGVDGESDDAYMARLASTLQLLAPRPILPNDFAQMALTIPGVGYAAAVNLYDPGPPVVTTQPRCVTLVLADPSGNPCSAGVKTQVDNLLQGLREVNFKVFEVDPGYVTVNVTYSVGMTPGYTVAGVVADCNAALTAYLSPASFAQASAGEVQGLWIPQAAVRWFDVGLVLAAVDGVDHVISLQVNGGTTDVTLPAPASLPKPGTMTGSAS